ncbi:MAG: hypothetical protein ABSH53_13835 [Holophaga sp.]|jgi:hypothetical protein
MPDLGQYEGAPITVGVTRAGEIFNTSVFAGDFFGLGDTPTAPKIRRAKDGAQTFKALPPLDKHMATQRVIACIHGLVKKHYDLGLQRNPYWTRDFFSAAAAAAGN